MIQFVDFLGVDNPHTYSTHLGVGCIDTKKIGGRSGRQFEFASNNYSIIFAELLRFSMEE